MTTVMRLAALCSAAILLVFAFGTAGQAQDLPQLTIKVTDPSGAVIPNASVSLTRGNEERTVQAGSNGVAEVPGLAIGEWNLAVKGTGFATKQRPVIVQGVSESVTVVLELAPLRQNLLVEAVEAPPSPVQLNATASGGSYLDVSVKDLPYNLTVINQEYMQERGITNLLDALDLVAGVTTWADTGYIPAVDIRGLSTTDAGIFIANDGVVQNSVPQAARNQDTFFMEAVEVLKGPASFSYGSGTAGAAINTRSMTPKRELGFRSLFSYESFGKTRVGLGVTGPLMKNLTGRIDFSESQGGTYIQRTHTKYRALNTALTWTPLERVTVSARGQIWKDQVGSYFATPILRSRVDPNVEYIELASNTFLDPRARTLNYNMQDPQNDVKNRRGSLLTEVDLSHGWKLQHKFNVATLMQDTLNAEGLSFNQTTLRVTPGSYFFNYKRDWLVSNELNVRNTYRFWGGRSVAFTVGGRVERNNQGRHAADNKYATNPATPSMDYLNPIVFAPIHRYTLRNRNVDTDYDTGYFESAFRIMPKLTLSGGVRWDHITNSVLTLTTNVRSTVSFHAVTGRYALTYQLTPTVTLYVGNSKAVQPASGGGNLNQTGTVSLINLTASQAQFAAQPSRGWEGGVKASTWRGRIEGTLSYFQMRKYGINTQELIDTTTVVERVGKVKSEGIDTMFTVSPIRWFSLQGDMVWNNARYLVFNTVANGVKVDRSGNWLPRVPAVQWSVTPIVRIGPVRGNISFRTRGASWNDANNLSRVPPQTVISSNITVVMAKGVRVTLTGRNLSDEIIINRGGIAAGATTARLGAPRNYSLQIVRDF